MENVLKETNFEFLGKKKTGKVRDIYEQAKRLILVTTDRHSSFDRIIAHIPWKGQVLNQISAFWFEQTKDIVPNHGPERHCRQEMHNGTCGGCRARIPDRCNRHSHLDPLRKRQTRFWKYRLAGRNEKEPEIATSDF